MIKLKFFVLLKQTPTLAYPAKQNGRFRFGVPSLANFESSAHCPLQPRARLGVSLTSLFVITISIVVIARALANDDDRAVYWSFSDIALSCSCISRARASN
eukprot:Tamp_23212.p1 GENE.Tamp_23212~~Tamp_23212.p1  ORF type:complete len:101 (-),score=2.84 Tamp_23212:6-308(-)